MKQVFKNALPETIGTTPGYFSKEIKKPNLVLLALQQLKMRSSLFYYADPMTCAHFNTMITFHLKSRSKAINHQIFYGLEENFMIR